MAESKLPSILVVDDNHDNADIIRDYLEARGYPVSVAYDGARRSTEKSAFS